MSLSTVPPELIFTLADNLPTASLNNLLRTCKSLRALLAPVLTTRITTEKRASSILQSGITNGHLPTVHLALAHKASWHTKPKGKNKPNGNNKLCYDALRAACESRQFDIAAILLTHFGPRIITQTRCHTHLFADALKHDDVALATVFLENVTRTGGLEGIDVEHVALDYAAMYGSPPMAELLIKHGAPVRTVPYCLTHAIHFNRWGVARVLLREGAPVPEWPEWAVQTPLTSRSPEQIEKWIQTGIASERAEWVEKLARFDAGRKYFLLKIDMFDRFIAGDFTPPEI